MIKISKSTTSLLILVVSFWLVLKYVFFAAVYPVYQGEVIYQSYENANSSGWLLDLAAIIFFTTIIASLGDGRRVSKYLVFFQLIFVIVPALVLHSALGVPAEYVFLLLISFFTFVIFVKYSPRINIPYIGERAGVMAQYFLFIIIVYVFGGLILGGGLGRLNFDLMRVYEFRGDYVSSAYFGMGYLVNWVAYVILPYYTVRAYFGKRYLVILGIMAMHLMLFGMTSVKTFLFIPFVIVVMMFLATRLNIYKLLTIVSGLLAIFLCIYYFFGDVSGAAFLDRTFFVPAALHNIYYDFFTKQSYAYFSGSGLGWLFSSDYSDSSVYVIAENYWGRRFSPNVGWMADAYSNLGWVGVIIMSFLLAVLLRIADELVAADGRPGWCEAMLIGPALALCSSALGTTMLTHGLLCFLFVVWAARGKRVEVFNGANARISKRL